MPNWVTERTWRPTELATAAFLNSHLRDNLNVLKNFINNDGTQAWTSVDFSGTGTWNDLDPGIAGNTTIRCTNASLLTITGLHAQANGTRVRIVSVGAGQVDLSYVDAGSAVGNRLYNAVTSGKTSLAAGVGVAEYVYSSTVGAWLLVHHEQGAWITRAFSAGNYTASAGSWTVASAARDAYWLKGRTLLYSANASGTTSGTPQRVIITLPFTTLTTVEITAAYISNTGTVEIGYVQDAVTNQIYVNRVLGNFGTGTVNVAFVVPLEVQ
jgi:hypothetical protein